MQLLGDSVSKWCQRRRHPHASSPMQAWKPNVKAAWSKSQTYPDLLSSLRSKRHGTQSPDRLALGCHTGRKLSLPRQVWVPCSCRREWDLPSGSPAVFLQYWFHFSLLCPSTPARPPCTAGFNTALGNGGSTHSCSRLKLEKYPEKGTASLAEKHGRLTQPSAAAGAILDSGTTESEGSPRNQSPQSKTRNISKWWNQATNKFSTICR